MAGESMEPPLVAVVEGDISDFLAKIEQVKAILRSLTGDDANVNIGANIGTLIAKVQEAKAVVETVPDEETVGVSADISGLMAKLAAAKAGLASLPNVKDIAIEAEVASFQQDLADGLVTAEGYWERIAELRRMATAVDVPTTVDVIKEQLAGAGSVEDQLVGIRVLMDDISARRAWVRVNTEGVVQTTFELAALRTVADAAGGGGGGGLGGILSKLGMGGGFLGLAGAGSALDFAGLGASHIALTLLGLAGSAAGGLLGGGLLAGGALSVAGTGFLTDLAGTGQALGDTKTAYTDMQNLAQAVALYGKNSSQASLASKQLQYDISTFPKVAQSSIVALAQLGQTIHAQFNAATGLAEKEAAQMFMEIGKAAEPFIPLIGKFAAENIKTIMVDIRPLLSWLDSSTGGMFIFRNLEQEFQNTLPQAIQAFSQGFELFLRVMNLASTFTGGFIDKLDILFTRLNTPAGFAEVDRVVVSLINDFHLWWDFVKALGEAIYTLFSHDAGTARAIVEYLTQMLQHVTAYMHTVQGGAAVHTIFEVHKEEILALLAVAVKLAEVFGTIYMAVAPTLVRIVTALADAAVAVFDFLQKAGPITRLFVDWGIALLLLNTRFFTGLNLIGLFGRALAALGTGALKLIGIDMATDVIAPLARAAEAARVFAVDATAAMGGVAGAVLLVAAALALAYEMWRRFDTVSRVGSATTQTLQERIKYGGGPLPAVQQEFIGDSGRGAVFITGMAQYWAAQTTGTNAAAQATGNYTFQELAAARAGQEYQRSQAMVLYFQQALTAASSGLNPQIASQATGMMNAAASAKTYEQSLGILTGGANKLLTEMATTATASLKLVGKVPSDMISYFSAIPGALNRLAGDTTEQIRRIVQSFEIVSLIKAHATEDAAAFGNTLLGDLQSDIPAVSGAALIIASKFNINPTTEHWGHAGTLAFLDAILGDLHSANPRVKRAADILAGQADIHQLMVQYGLVAGVGFGDGIVAGLNHIVPFVTRAASNIGSIIGRSVAGSIAGLERLYGIERSAPTPRLPYPIIPGVPVHRQYGGDLAPGSLAWVGEGGVGELINIGRYGGSVTSAAQMQGATAATHVSVAPTIVVLDGQKVGQIVWGYAREEALRTTYRQTRAPMGLGPARRGTLT